MYRFHSIAMPSVSPHSSIITRSCSIFRRSICSQPSSHPRPSPPFIFSASLLDCLWLLCSLNWQPRTLHPSWFFPKHVYVSLRASERECSIATQLQVSAKRMLFSLPLHVWSSLETTQVESVMLPVPCPYPQLLLPRLPDFLIKCFFLPLLPLCSLFLYLLQLVPNYCTSHQPLYQLFSSVL